MVHDPLPQGGHAFIPGREDPWDKYHRAPGERWTTFYDAANQTRQAAEDLQRAFATLLPTIKEAVRSMQAVALEMSQLDEEFAEWDMKERARDRRLVLRVLLAMIPVIGVLAWLLSS